MNFSDQTGDKICLFGFSRGAYQVRIIAGMIKVVSPVIYLHFWEYVAHAAVHRLDYFARVTTIRLSCQSHT